MLASLALRQVVYLSVIFLIFNQIANCPLKFKQSRKISNRAHDFLDCGLTRLDEDTETFSKDGERVKIINTAG